MQLVDGQRNYCTSEEGQLVSLMDNPTTLVSDDLCYERHRLETFKRYLWPSNTPISCEKLAKAGFYYCGNGDEVICFACNGSHSGWRINDQAIVVHAEKFPDCPFIKGENTMNIPCINYTANCVQQATNSSNSSGSLGLRAGVMGSRHRHGSGNELAFGEVRDTRFEQYRLSTFRHWPNNHVHAADLAKWGFYYTGHGDMVQCAFCGGRLSSWRAGEIPADEHRKHFGSSCRFLLDHNVENVPLDMDFVPSFSVFGHSPEVELSVLTPTVSSGHRYGSALNSDNSIDVLDSAAGERVAIARNMSSNHVKVLLQQDVNLDSREAYRKHMADLGVFVTPPAAPDMNTYNARLRSFDDWPNECSQRPHELAEAGFYFAGTSDAVKCFQCGGGLRRWLPSDDVWVEHARWFPRCDYVLSNKGHTFVRMAVTKQNNAESVHAEADGAWSDVGGILSSGMALQERIDNDARAMLQIAKHTPTSLVELAACAPTLQIDAEQISQALQLGYQEELVVAALVDNSMQLFAGISDLIERMESLRRMLSDDEQHTSLLKQSKISQELGSSSMVRSRTDSFVRSKAAEDANRLLREHRVCKICMDNEACMVFLPCGHLVTCARCAPAFNQCPICRVSVLGTVRTYLS